ncbi:DUF2381 family protein [Corallococcus exiguus]|uniref:DUF2381 family protein n=1 Tax=Corallococcus exiguus TaxID=83462 RepID=UPI001471A717|nr:DUF2381 family protein [Corallococcus exiguus]NNB86372.1 DUF2381 family protein [Corallococcus exiguus]
MRVLPLLRCGLLLVLIASPSLARDVSDKLTIRTLKVPAHPAQEASSIYVSWQVVTALRFEAEVDPARTKFLGWEGRFEAPLIGGKKVILEPLRELDSGEALPLLVTLVDGTDFMFLVRAKSQERWGWIDYQVNVFKDPDSYDAVLSSLYDSLSRERKLSEANERFKQEENSVDHAYATLLANGQVKKTPFRRAKFWRSKNEDMDMVVEVFSGPEKAAAVIHLTNTYHGQSWRFDAAYLTRDFSSDTARPFALRMNRSVLVEGQSGRIAVVVDKSAFEDKDGQLADLALQIFRDDGLLQVFVAMDHTLLRQ